MIGNVIIDGNLYYQISVTALFLILLLFAFVDSKRVPFLKCPLRNPLICIISISSYILISQYIFYTYSS